MPRPAGREGLAGQNGRTGLSMWTPTGPALVRRHETAWLAGSLLVRRTAHGVSLLREAGECKDDDCEGFCWLSGSVVGFTQPTGEHVIVFNHWSLAGLARSNRHSSCIADCDLWPTLIPLGRCR